MPAHPPGRRTESLFDNRYRYDYIYPRGRSGETLRAYDTLDNDRPVVIKRPAPQDAPPMRAGQEVSIRVERQALERLSGHPVLTELRGHGTFRVGGHTHEYIVMDLATGETVEEMVLQAAARGALLPELEVLVIVDHLLDLLVYAHDRQVVYNDVDAKHLFWDRTAYRLKVIDWGNAVFLDEPGASPAVTRATDIRQVGELLYFILTGGDRLMAETDEESGHFYVNFGDDAEHISPRLQAIITRAVHPDPRRRFGTLLELRHALNEYRLPLQKARDEIVSRVRRRVRPTASQEELIALRDELTAAFEMDPGYPEAVRLAAEIQSYLRQISVQADLDAIRIYLESGNWSRALALLDDLLPQADPLHEPLIRFLISASATLDELAVTPPPQGFLGALERLFTGDAQGAGRALLTTAEVRVNARQAQWLLAEQLAVCIPEVILLRPHLVKLRKDLSALPQARLAMTDLNEVERLLDSAPLPGLTGLLVVYRHVADLLAGLEEGLVLLKDMDASPTLEGAAASARRAHQATEALVSLLEETGQHVYGDPARAGDSLYRAAQIDPLSPHFAALHDYFDEVHQAVTALQHFRPRPGGETLASWFEDVQRFLQPYLDDLSDPRLHEAARALAETGGNWTTIVNYLALGRRRPTVTLLRETGDLIRPINEHLAAWFGDLANRLPDAPFVEKFSPNQALADALIEGWQAWDRGDALAAAEAGRRAYTVAVTDGERLAANRLRRLGELLERWMREGSVDNPQATAQIEAATLALLLSDEEQERQTFAAQMPSQALYLRAMGRGLVAFMQQSSSAGWRALYFAYVLRGAQALAAGELEEADFWRSAAQISCDSARTHIAFQLFDRALTSRQLIRSAQQAMNAVARPGDLSAVRSALNAPMAGEMLAGVPRAIELVEEALRHWSDGDFHAARQALDAGRERLERACEVTGLQIEPFLEWLGGLREAVARLQQLRLAVEQGAVTSSPDPDPAIAEALATIAAVTLERLGPDQAHQVRQWNDMYQAVLETYTTQRLSRRDKLAAFDRHFASLFITRHPAYPLFRHWKALVEQLPPEEPEEDMIHLDMEGISAESGAPIYEEERRLAQSEGQRESDAGADRIWNRVILGAVLVLALAVGAALLRALGGGDGESARPTPEPTSILATRPFVAAALTPVATATRTDTSTPTETFPPTATMTTQPTATEETIPTLTPTPFVTSTLVPSSTPAPVAMAEVSGASSTHGDVLAALAQLPIETWPGQAGALTFVEGEGWQISTAETVAGEVRLEIPPQLLSELFQPGVANALRRVDAVLELVRYNQAALAEGGVAFGLGAANALGQWTVGEVQFLETNFVSLGLNQNGRFRSTTEFPQSDPQLRLSVRRTDATTLSFFVNERWLGDSVFLFPQSEPVTLILYVAGRDVVVRLQSLELDYSPREEIP